MQNYTFDQLNKLVIRDLKIIAKKQFGLAVLGKSKVYLIIQILKKQQGEKIITEDNFSSEDYQQARQKLEKLIWLETTDIHKMPRLE